MFIHNAHVDTEKLWLWNPIMKSLEMAEQIYHGPTSVFKEEIEYLHHRSILNMVKDCPPSPKTTLGIVRSMKSQVVAAL